jgi:molybdate/tungstate transport system substrate-binding protein
MSRRWYALLLGLIVFAAGCGPTHARAAAPAVQVLYAGSLTEVMEDELGPAFRRATGIAFDGRAGGSQALAHELAAGLVAGDVFISASPAVDATLLGRGRGHLRWYAVFARSPLVLAYNPHSRFAAELRAQSWIEVATTPGFRLGRTDPKLDPKGRLTVAFVSALARAEHQPNLAARLLGGAENPAQIFPEETLVGRLESDQLDAGFFYRVEAVAAGLPYISLPSALTPSATFTVAVPVGAPHEAAAEAFVRFLLGARGRRILRQAGLDLTPIAVVGDRGAIPAGLRAVLR